MKRWWPVILGIVLGLVAMAIGGFLSWRKNGREQAAVTFSSLAVCIAGGPARVAPENASLHARLLHYSATDPTIATCVPFRDALASSRWVQHEMPLLAALAQNLNLGPFQSYPKWHLEDLWRAAETLPWRPPVDFYGARIPKSPSVLVELELKDALTAPPLRHRKLDNRLDPYPPNRIVVAEDGDYDVVVVDGPTQRLSQVERAKRDKPSDAPPTLLPDTGKALVTTIEDQVIWVEGTHLHVYLLRDWEHIVVDLPGTAREGIQSCRAPNRRILALSLSTESTVLLYELRGASITHLGRIIDVQMSAVNLSCDEYEVRAAWAFGEPDNTQKVDAPRNGYQNIVVATCTRGGCTKKWTRFELNAGWYTSGGYGADWNMNTVPVYALGKNVLIVWEGDGALWYRLAPLEALGSTRNSWIAEMAHEHLSYDGDPALLTRAEMKVLTRGDIALLSINAMQDKKQIVLVGRFNDEGQAYALRLVR